MGRETRTVREHVERQTQWEIRRAKQETIREGVRACHKHFARGEYADAAEVLRDCMMKPLGVSPRNVGQIVHQVVNSEFDADLRSTVEFVEHPDAYVDFFHRKETSVTDPAVEASYRADGYEVPEETARLVVENAFVTLENASKVGGILPTEMTNHAEVTVLDQPIGVVYNRFEYDLPPEVHTVEKSGEPGAIAIQGEPGSGKSNASGTLAEACYLGGEKVIDVLDWQEFENVTYDVPQNQENMRKIRDKLEYATEWDDIDFDDPSVKADGPPEVEILCPLTPKLCDSKVPYDTVSDQYRVRPFVIPTSSIEKRVLKAMMSHTTDVQSSVLERAFQKTNREFDDWSVGDLASVILKMGEVDDGVKRRLTTILQTLENSGFLSTHDDPYAIDWERIFRDQSTITCFSVALIDDPAEKLMVMSYIVNSLLQVRQELEDYPPLATVFRELHLITKAKGWNDPRESQVGQAIIDEFDKFSTLHRHVDCRIIADSQQFERQIVTDVRENFDKGFTFTSKYDQAKSFTTQYGGGIDRKYVQKIVYQLSTGECCYLGESNVEERAFHMPIQMSPRLSHAIDSDMDDNGFQCRVDYLDHEELRPAPWSLDSRSEVDEARRTGETAAPKRDRPVAKFVHEHVDTRDEDYRLTTEKFRDAYAAYAAKRGYPTHNMGRDKTTIGRRLGAYLDKDEDYQKRELTVDNGDRYDGRRQMTYQGLRLSDEAEKLLEHAHEAGWFEGNAPVPTHNDELPDDGSSKYDEPTGGCPECDTTMPEWERVWTDFVTFKGHKCGYCGYVELSPDYDVESGADGESETESD